MKNIHVYSAALPAMAEMIKAVESENRFFKDCEPNQFSSFGFSENGITNMANGYEMKFMFEEKILPKPVINRECQKRIEAEEEMIGMPLERKERDTIKERVVQEMLERALTKVTAFSAYYHANSERVFVDVSSEDLAGRAMGEMCHALKSLKTSTLHVSNVSNSLTQNIRECIDTEQDLSFSGFYYADKLHMKNSDKESVKFDCDYTLEHVAELIDSGYSVKRVRLAREGVSFDLTDDFKIKTIRHEFEAGMYETKEEAEQNLKEGLLEIMAANVQELVDYFSKSDEQNEGDQVIEAPDTVEEVANPFFNDEGKDVFQDEAVAFVKETRKANVSSIQRKFRIGYNRAARIIEQMECDGLVSTPGHNGAREVLVPADE